MSNLNTNQPQVYIYPLPFEPPSHLPPHPTPLGDTEPLFEFPEPHSEFPLALYFTSGNVHFHVTLSVQLTLSSPLPMFISLFSVSVSPLLPTAIREEKEIKGIYFYPYLPNSKHTKRKHFKIWGKFNYNEYSKVPPVFRYHFLHTVLATYLPGPHAK